MKTKAEEALDRLDGRFPSPTGTNYHVDIDIIRKALDKMYKRAHAAHQALLDPNLTEAEKIALAEQILKDRTP